MWLIDIVNSKVLLDGIIRQEIVLKNTYLSVSNFMANFSDSYKHLFNKVIKDEFHFTFIFLNKKY